MQDAGSLKNVESQSHEGGAVSREMLHRTETEKV